MDNDRPPSGAVVGTPADAVGRKLGDDLALVASPFLGRPTRFDTLTCTFDDPSWPASGPFLIRTKRSQVQHPWMRGAACSMSTGHRLPRTCPANASDRLNSPHPKCVPTREPHETFAQLEVGVRNGL